MWKFHWIPSTHLWDLTLHIQKSWKITKILRFLARNLVKNEKFYFLKRRASSLEPITQCVKVSSNSVNPSLRSDAPHPKIRKNNQIWWVLSRNLVRNKNFHFPKGQASSLESIAQCVKVSLNSFHPSLRSDAERTKMTKNNKFWPVYDPWSPWTWASQLATHARTLRTSIYIHWPSFVKLGDS